jgi:hypothetical protein
MQKMNINLDLETGDLLQWLATACKLTVSEIIDKLISGHLSELWELRTLMESCSADENQLGQAANLLTSLGGGESILSGIGRINPGYVTLGAQFLRDLNAPPLHLVQSAL